jgi:PepSY-associated TM region
LYSRGPLGDRIPGRGFVAGGGHRLLIHLKGSGRQLFRFRPERGARLAWVDLHKVLGTWGLPAQVMFAFTGAFICLGELLLPGFVGPVFDGDRSTAERALYGDYSAAPARGEPGSPLPLGELLGLGGCATILSGNAIWLARREARGAHRGNRALARLTAAVSGGMALAVAALLAANRVLPLGWHGRADAEIQICIGVWLAAGIVCLAARDLRTLWTILLGLAGLLFAVVPVLGLVMRPLGLFDLGTLPGHPVAVVDLVLLSLGAALLVAARHVRRTGGAREVTHD